MSVVAEPLVGMLIDLVRLPSQNPGDEEAAVARPANHRDAFEHIPRDQEATVT